MNPSSSLKQALGTNFSFFSVGLKTYFLGNWFSSIISILSGSILSSSKSLDHSINLSFTSFIICKSFLFVKLLNLSVKNL